MSGMYVYLGLVLFEVFPALRFSGFPKIFSVFQMLQRPVVLDLLKAFWRSIPLLPYYEPLTMGCGNEMLMNRWNIIKKPWNITSWRCQLGWLFPTEWEHKIHVPNHHPDQTAWSAYRIFTEPIPGSLIKKPLSWAVLESVRTSAISALFSRGTMEASDIIA